MKVVSIGSNGLLSTALGYYCIKKKHSLVVYGLERPKYHCDTFVFCNLLKDNQDFNQCLDADLIIYASGAGIQSNLHEDPSIIYNLNVTAPITLINYLKIHGFSGSFITFGSYFEIGANTEDKRWNEKEILHTDMPVPNDYCVSKRMLTRFADSISLPFEYRHFILPTIYAEYESPFRLIPMTVSNLLQGKDNVYTAGEQVRQYIYIDQVIQIVFNAYDAHIQSGIYNIEGEETFSVKELVKKIYSFFNESFDKLHFGGIQRADIGMKNLQLDGTILNKHLSQPSKVLLIDILPKYEQMLNKTK